MDDGHRRNGPTFRRIQKTLQGGAGIDRDHGVQFRTPMTVVPLLIVLTPAEEDLIFR